MGLRRKAACRRSISGLTGGGVEDVRLSGSDDVGSAPAEAGAADLSAGACAAGGFEAGTRIESANESSVGALEDERGGGAGCWVADGRSGGAERCGADERGGADVGLPAGDALALLTLASARFLAVAEVDAEPLA
jgi:hypothetical protein